MSPSRKHNTLNRRDFLQGATTIAAGLALTTFGAGAAVGNLQAGPRKRKSITALNASEVAAWRAGVRVMRQRSVANPADPTGWLFQANMHGSAMAGPFFGMCQHGHWWFLPWHRMYIFFFEQILLKAIDVSGVARPADFGLPYWDYTGDLPTQSIKRTIPQVLRDRMYMPGMGMPAAPNPLFESQRISTRNREIMPAPLDASAVATSAAFSLKNFVNTSTGVISGFGGRNRLTPTYFDPNRAGAFEGTPHGTVHTGVGGKMSNFETAAQDPIFWTHHCNLDRLWNTWLAEAVTENPNPNGPWGQQEFTFFDGNGAEVSLNPARFLNSVQGNLIDYVYDDGSTPLPAPVIALNASTELDAGHESTVASTHAGEHAEVDPMPAPQELLSFPPRFALTAKASSVSVSIPEATQDGVESIVASSAEAIEAHPSNQAVLLSIDGIEMSGVLDGHYEVYLNLPEGVEPDFTGPYFVGNVVPFALAAHGHTNHEGANEASPAEVSMRWDVTKVVRSIRQNNLWKKSGFKVTFVPKGVDDVADQEAARLTFRSFRILELKAMEDH